MSLGWRIEYEGRARKQLTKLDRTAAARIVRYLQEDLDRTGDPRGFGEAMIGNGSGFWRYRVGDYRAIAGIEDAASPFSSSRWRTGAQCIVDATPPPKPERSADICFPTPLPM